MAGKKGDSSSLNQLKEQLKSSCLSPIYVFYGEEDYLKHRYLEMLRDKIVRPEFAEFNHMVFEGKTLSLDKLLDAVVSYPVMAEKKLVVVKDLDLHALKADMPIMEKILDSADESVCLVLFYETIEYKDPRGKLSELIKSKGLVVNFDYQPNDRLISWAKKHFESMQKGIEPQALSYLVDMCGPSMNNLANEIEKICAYVKGKAVTLNDVKEIAIPALDATIFELTDALAACSYDKAYRIMDELMALQVEPIIIVPAIAKTIADIYRIKVALQSGIMPEKAAADFKINAYVARKLSEPARRIEAPLLRQWIYCCADADLKLKSSPLDKRVIMESLIGSMISKDINWKGAK